MNAFDTIYADHASLRELLNQIPKANADADRENLYADFRVLFETHTQKESAVVWPLVREYSVTLDNLHRADREYESLVRYFAQLDELPVSDLQWLSIFSQMAKLAELHFYGEETNVFPFLKSRLPSKIENCV